MRISNQNLHSILMKKIENISNVIWYERIFSLNQRKIRGSYWLICVLGGCGEKITWFWSKVHDHGMREEEEEPLDTNACSRSPHCKSPVRSQLMITKSKLPHFNLPTSRSPAPQVDILTPYILIYTSQLPNANWLPYIEPFFSVPDLTIFFFLGSQHGHLRWKEE